MAPRQAPAQVLLVLRSNPTRNRPSPGRTSFSATADYLIMYPKILPTLSHHFLIQYYSQHQQAITEKVQQSRHAVLLRSQVSRCQLVTGCRYPEWCLKKWPRAMDKSPGCTEA